MFAFDATFWRDRRVFVTGHTGFKGAWLSLWLTGLGARVTGLSLPPHTDPSLFALCAEGRCTDVYGDIADPTVVAGALAGCEPEIVIHMAAQALVRPSYLDPLGTYATNVMGTANLLQAVRSVASVRAVVVVTSDKAVARSPRTTASAVTIPTAIPRRAPSLSPVRSGNVFSRARARSRRRGRAMSSAAGIGRRSAFSVISSRHSKRDSPLRCAIPRPFGLGSMCSTRSRAI